MSYSFYLELKNEDSENVTGLKFENRTQFRALKSTLKGPIITDLLYMILRVVSS